MSEDRSPFIKFTYTILDPSGIPRQKSWVVNLSYIISVEATPSNDLKIHLINHQVLSIQLGKEMSANDVMDEILSLSAEGMDYSVYNIDSYTSKSD